MRRGRLAAGGIVALASMLPLGAAHAAPVVSWQVATASPRGIMVEYTMVNVSGISFRAIRLHAGAVSLHWHVGSSDPPVPVGTVPVDAGSSVSVSSECRAGLVALFNGGFKISAHAGGAMVDGHLLSPMVPGDATLAINRTGQWELGVWGTPGFPTMGFHAIELRQNLPPLVQRGQVAQSARRGLWRAWGDPLHEQPAVARSALGVDASGNLIYVATITGVVPAQLGEALRQSGVVTGMELDINPFWPVVGASFHPLHAPGPLPVQIPFSAHDPRMYFSGWTRDFFVAVAEPDTTTCSWQSPGLSDAQRRRGTAIAQPLTLAGTGCLR